MFSPLYPRTPARRAAAPRRGLALFLGLLLAALGVVPPGGARAGSPTNQTDGATTTKGPVVEFVPGEVLVRFRDGAFAARATAAKGDDVAVTLRAQFGEIGAEVEHFGGSEIVENLRLARVHSGDTLEAIAAFSARADVLYAEPNFILRETSTIPNDTRFGEMYGLRNTGQNGGNPDADVDADDAWDITQGSKDVVVGVIDGGIDVNHPDLRDNLWVNPGDSTVDGVDNDNNGFRDDVNGWDFVHGDRTVYDNPNEDSHGTHVAGTVGARGNNGVGVTGVNWQVSLMSIKVCGGPCVDSDILEGYNYARLMKQRGINLRVLNNSYGGTGFSQSRLDAINALAAEGILFVAAAGNDASDNFSFPHYPSDYAAPNIINVAATDRFDNVSSFSNFGARVVSMGAPGSSILSTTPNNTYSVFSGTSMASPHVAGAAALVVAAKPGISLPELKGVILYGGDLLAHLLRETTTGRRLNAYKSVQSALENDTTPPAPAGNLRISNQSGRSMELSWTAPGDDGMSGTAADYDIFFVSATTGARTLLPSFISPAPGGAGQSTSAVSVPLRNFSGTIELRAYDNAGNSSMASVPVTVGQNPQTDPYVVTLGAPAPLSTGGERLVLNGDDKYREGYNLGFNFPSYANHNSTVTVSTNGVVYLSTPPKRDNGDADDAGSSVFGLRGQRMIAGLWDDIIVDNTAPGRSGDGVYVVRPDANTVIFRWHGVTFDAPNTPVNFEIEMRLDGTIIYRYGDGNTNLFPVVGLGVGEPDAYVVASHTTERGSGPRKILTGAQTVTISPRPFIQSKVQFSAANYTVSENAGAATITVTRTGDTAYSRSVLITASDGTATQNSDYANLNQTLTFAPSESAKTFALTIHNDALVEPDETVRLSVIPLEQDLYLGTPGDAVLTITNDDVAGPNTVQFESASHTVGEAGRSVRLRVTRTGDTTNAATVFYQTSDASASDRSDYTAALGTLRFGVNETSRTFDVFVTNDVLAEADETFTVSLSNAFQATLGAQTSATVTVTSDDAATGANPVKAASFDPSFFVRMHYIDFFNREPDQGGLNFWVNQTTNCGNADLQVCRNNVSAAFFVSGEFQQTGYLVYRIHQAAFNAGPNLQLRTFLADTQEIGRGYVGGQAGSEQLLEQNKQAFASEFVTRAPFVALYPASMTAAGFVDALNANTNGSLSAAERDALVNGLNAGTLTRAQALRAVAEDTDFQQREYARAFVLMQYFGYLRRNPNDQTPADFSGYNFWLGKLNSFGGNYITAQMVQAFITSGEYYQRFGP